MNNRLRVALHPVPELEKFDTSLRYTDILFGFVIRELFLRIQNWLQLSGPVRWHLAIGTLLVLGSWVGFRRSLNRSSYQLKFFNLPLSRFAADQLMLILYFRLAVVTSVDGVEPPTADTLAATTTWLVMLIFILYVVWDLIGIWIANATLRDQDGQKKPRYPKVGENNERTSEYSRADWAGLGISGAGLVIIFFLWLASDCLNGNCLFAGMCILLLGYRFVKEIRTSWRLL